MAQQQWTVPGYGGVPYNVGLYHGVKTGHLLVHCNGKPLIVDFGIKGDKDYSFLLGEELYELKILKKNEQFEYLFTHNEEAQTPHNVRRNKDEKTDKNRLWAIGILFVVLIASIFFIRSYWSNQETNIRERLQSGEGHYTEAKLLEEGGKWLILYKVNEEIVKQQLLVEDTISILGYPLQQGDGYQARIMEGHKYIYLLDWTQADNRTHDRLLKLSLDRHQSLHTELSSREISCQLRIAYELEGIEGLAKFYQQNEQDWPVYNTDAYLRLIRSTSYKELYENCILGLEE